jgi:hypothetical protein
MKPAIAYSAWGKLLVSIIRCLLFFVHLIKGKEWQRPKKDFSEDPSRYSRSDIIFFAYKYYFRAIEEYDNRENELYINNVTSDWRPVVPGNNGPVVNLHAGGDLMPYEWIRKDFCTKLWDDIGEDFFGGDIVTANLETPVDTAQAPGYVPEVMLNDMEFNATPEMFDVFNGNLKFKGFDILSAANNHTLDKGETGVRGTIDFLKSRSILFSGIAGSEDESDHIPIIEKQGMRFAFISVTYSLNRLSLPPGKEYLCNHIELNRPGVDLTKVKKMVTRAYSLGADIVIGSMHYGNAYQLFPSSHIINNTKRLFEECGLDIILGVHSHNLQPWTAHQFTCPVTGRMKQGLAFYGLGDFVAYDIFTWAHLPVYVKIQFCMSGGAVVPCGFELVPVYVYGNYKNAGSRDLRLLNAHKLWKEIEQGRAPEYFSAFHIQEASYLEKIFHKVYGPHFVKPGMQDRSAT